MAEIAVLVIDSSSRKHAQLIDDTRPVRDLIPLLVRRLGMPKELSYQMIPTDTGRPLPVNDSLAQSDIPPGAELRLAPLHDSIYDEVLRALYKEAKDYVR